MGAQIIMESKIKHPQKSGRLNPLLTMIQSTLIIVLIILVFSMMLQIQSLQGTARVVNYAGLVRGATQREVKLEICNKPNDKLIEYLDDVLHDLKYEDGKYNLVSLHDSTYQQLLTKQIRRWQDLKNEIYLVRKNGYRNTDIVNISEDYFNYADRTVTASEKYSEKIASHIRYIEYASAFVMFLLIVLIISQYLYAIKIARANRILKQKAYLDAHTGLPNKSRCEELLRNTGFLPDSIGFIMFDLNNLKVVNDTLGHTAGDALIANFARILRNVMPQKDFVGRYGGDEFIVILHDVTSEQYVKDLLQHLIDEVDYFNGTKNHTPISFAHGYTLSSEYTECTLRTLLDKADHNMYINKKKTKHIL